MNPATGHERHIAFEACFNMRDLGGYIGRDGRRTRSRTLYRADGLHRLTDHDLESFSALGIKLLVDLRTNHEVATVGAFRVDRIPLHRVLLPMADGLATPPPGGAPTTDDRGLSYANLAAAGSEAIVDALTLMAQPDRLPAVFHCSAGRDRTGILAAVVLGLLGVNDDDIVADYALSQIARAATDEWVTANDPVTLELWSRYPSELRNTRPETMVRFLDVMRHRHGSITDYALAAGLAPSAIEALETALLDS